MQVPLDGNPRNVAGILDQLQVNGFRSAHLTIENGERAEDLSLAREQRSRPNGANTIGLEEVTVVVPKRVAENVGDKHRFPPIDGSAAGCASRANGRGTDVRCKPWETRRSHATEMLAISIRKPNSA